MALHEREITAPVDLAGPAGLPRAATLPGTLGEGPARSRTRTVQLEFTHHDDATHLSASGPRVRLEVTAHRPPGHQSLGVVVPWSQQFYQYTVKDLARPATGTLWVDGVPHELPGGRTWATLDHGRGRWHRDVRWNWAAGSGTVDGQTVGVQVGGQWPNGTGSTENACSWRVVCPRSAPSWSGPMTLRTGWPPGVCRVRAWSCASLRSTCARRTAGSGTSTHAGETVVRCIPRPWV